MNVQKTEKPTAPTTQTPPAPAIQTLTTPTTQTPPDPIPGLDVVGHGIYLRTRQPYELKDVLFKWGSNRTYCSREIDKNYAIPEGYEVNDSPPMPADQALNQTLIEESWERLDKQLGLNTQLAASNAIFSIGVNSNQTSNLLSERDCYYALRSSFIPFWSVYLPGTARFSETLDMLNKAVADVPLFRHIYRREYDKFFDQYGTHYVKRAWIGGRATLAFIVAKSSDMTKEQIQAGIQASFGGLGSGSASNLQVNKEKLKSNSECKVFGKGGDESKLAMLSSLDEASYNEWLKTIKDNPQVIELEVAGIWTLISDQAKAGALQEAYSEATTFKPITGIFTKERSQKFNADRKIYFVRNDSCFSYNLAKREAEIPKLITDVIPGLQDDKFAEFQWPDASFTAAYLGENLNRKAFLFKRDKCIRVDVDTGEIDEGYPKSVKDEWPGVEAFDRIDAVLNAGPDSVYFFRGIQYIRFNTERHRADEGYPDLVSKRWVGVIFDRIDAAIYWGDSKVYFFKNNQYIRYDMSTYRADAGYPKFIPSNYVEDLEVLS